MASKLLMKLSRKRRFGLNKLKYHKPKPEKVYGKTTKEWQERKALLTGKTLTFVMLPESMNQYNGRIFQAYQLDKDCKAETFAGFVVCDKNCIRSNGVLTELDKNVVISH